MEHVWGCARFPRSSQPGLQWDTCRQHRAGSDGGEAQTHLWLCQHAQALRPPYPRFRTFFSLCVKWLFTCVCLHVCVLCVYICVHPVCAHPVGMSIVCGTFVCPFLCVRIPYVWGRPICKYLVCTLRLIARAMFVCLSGVFVWGSGGIWVRGGVKCAQSTVKYRVAEFLLSKVCNKIVAALCQTIE